MYIYVYMYIPCMYMYTDKYCADLMHGQIKCSSHLASVRLREYVEWYGLDIQQENLGEICLINFKAMQHKSPEDVKM